MNIITLFLIVTGFAGVGPAPSFQALAQAVVQTMRATGEQAARQVPSGPVFIDMASFDAAAKSLGEPPIDHLQLVQSVGADSKPGLRADAILRTQASGRHRAEVSNDGMYITVISATRTAAGVQVIAEVNWTDRRPSGAAAIGTHRMRLSFAPINNKWVLQKSETLMQT